MDFTKVLINSQDKIDYISNLLSECSSQDIDIIEKECVRRRKFLELNESELAQLKEALNQGKKHIEEILREEKILMRKELKEEVIKSLKEELQNEVFKKPKKVLYDESEDDEDVVIESKPKRAPAKNAKKK